MTDDILLPRVLITNDDGIDAQGLALLAEIAQDFAQEVWIVAPNEDQSGASQKLSLRQPLQVVQRKENVFSVIGTPSDCVALALDFLMNDGKPDLVLSGVNAAGNTGDALNLSGTVGAAMMALTLGVPAIAISQESARRGQTPWATTRAVLPAVLTGLLKDGWRRETCLNVNIPDLPPEEIKGYGWARQGQKNIARVDAGRRINPRGETYFWLSLGNTPCAPNPNDERSMLERGEIAVTALSLDRSLDLGKPFVSFSRP